MRVFDPFSNLIEVYINRLRRKIDPDGSSGLLQTRRGAGYILKSGEDTETAGRGQTAGAHNKANAPDRKKHA